jgi:hypothetical protein
MGSPIRSGYPNIDRTTQPGSIRACDGIYDCVPRLWDWLHRCIGIEFGSSAIVIINTPNRGRNRCSEQTLRDVECDR